MKERQMTIGAVVLIIVMLIVALALTIMDYLNYRTLDRARAFQQNTCATDSLFVFDPNTVSYEELLALGFEKSTAVSLLKYRSRGKVFEIAEELALCYGVTDSMYFKLRPYIVIGEQFKSRPKVSQATVDTLRQVRQKQWEEKRARLTPHPFEKFRIDTVGMAYLQQVGFSYRQAEGLIEYRDRGPKGIRNMAELADCWAVTTQMADSLKRYVIFPEKEPYDGKVEINSADSSAHVALPGIGAKSAMAIIEYRKLLGGYVSIDQLSELKCITNENFARFSKQICCDSCVFSKIDINFAPASGMEYHPYMTRKAINRIIELRKSKGGWKSFEEIVNDNIFTKEQAVKLEPYLHFGTIPLELLKNQ